MIIKYTFNDNDFTQIIEKYLEEYGPFGRWVPGGNVDRITDLMEIYNKHNDKYNEEKELSKEAFLTMKNELLKELYHHFIAYINNIQENSSWNTDGFIAKDLIENKEYIIDNIKINLVKSIPDQWENGEVVYFITSNEKYVTM